uniref:Uncharacterized protein n=1 Tax=Brassica oleracea var. oleracea TaxID=109376 RepID=A0A0D3BUF9_BRAOL
MSHLLANLRKCQPPLLLLLNRSLSPPPFSAYNIVPRKRFTRLQTVHCTLAGKNGHVWFSCNTGVVQWGWTWSTVRTFFQAVKVMWDWQHHRSRLVWETKSMSRSSRDFRRSEQPQALP